MNEDIPDTVEDAWKQYLERRLAVGLDDDEIDLLRTVFMAGALATMVAICKGGFDAAYDELIADESLKIEVMGNA